MANVSQIEDKNGVVKDIVDKGLDEKTSQNSIASSDYVLLEDINGAYHKIAKASFTEAVRSALGAVINSVAKGNDIAKVPVLDSNNDLGMGTLANLASVLGAMVCDITGAPYRKPSIQASARTSIRTSGLYTYTGDPYGTLIVFNSGYYQCQIDIPADLQYQYVTIRTSNNDNSDWTSYSLERH